MILETLTAEEREQYRREYEEFLDSIEPSPVDPDRLTAEPNEPPTLTDTLTARAYRRAAERYGAKAAKRMAS